MKFILGSKFNMAQLFDRTGTVVPVTVVKVGPVKIVQVKTKDGKDGYSAVQVGFGNKKKISKALMGHSRTTSGGFQYLTEFRIKGEDKYELGQELNISQFSVGDYVDVQATSFGKGFTGVVKRYGFKGAPASHGHDHPRAVGSIGSMYPQHVFKGRKMAGRMGGNLVTVKNLEVAEIDAEHNLLFLKGAVPGSNGSLLKIAQSLKPARKIKETKAEAVDSKE